jgi:Fur family peroxide stress response transcriptional regulator
MQDGTDRFDAIREEHYHFICSKCHNITDVYEHIPLNVKIGNNIVSDYQITFTGICEDCLRKEE